MALRKEAEAALKGEEPQFLGDAEKAVDASTLPPGWAAAVDGDGDTYYVRLQPPHSCANLRLHCTPLLDSPASAWRLLSPRCPCVRSWPPHSCPPHWLNASLSPCVAQWNKATGVTQWEVP